MKTLKQGLKHSMHNNLKQYQKHLHSYEVLLTQCVITIDFNLTCHARPLQLQLHIGFLFSNGVHGSLHSSVGGGSDVIALRMQLLRL